ncbi:DUF1196 domain-containing protein, partial [Vibrio cholerae]|nr:DUF1196 domain-containing protein [Vibrio cholerae]
VPLEAFVMCVFLMQHPNLKG